MVDLRLKFGLEHVDFTRRTRIIAVQASDAAQVGVFVDGVSEVLNLAADSIDDTPRLGDGEAAPYLMVSLSLCKNRGKLLQHAAARLERLWPIDVNDLNSWRLDLSGPGDILG